MPGTKRLLALPIALVAALAGGAAQSVCGPFTDVPPALCSFVAELYYAGITAGTSPTTFSPGNQITRGQAAVFVAKGLNQALKRSSRRAALAQWGITKGQDSFGLTSIGGSPQQCRSDGADLWVANLDGWVSRVRASDGRLLETWTGATAAAGVLVAMGRIFITGEMDPGALYMIDPARPLGSVSTVASDLGGNPRGITFDGSQIWTANATGSVSILRPGPTLPWSVTTITEGFTAPSGILFDRTNVWVMDSTAQALLKLHSDGSVLQTVPVGGYPAFPTFDGTNIWVPYSGGLPVSGKILVVRASTGTVVADLSGNTSFFPREAAFDGERALVVTLGGSISIWSAAQLQELGSATTDLFPQGACSDGTNFWITSIGGFTGGDGQLIRF